MPVPKKVRAALDRLNIRGIVGGYVTCMPADDFIDRCKGKKQAAYTCWNQAGKVVCVLVKGRDDSVWRLRERL